MKTQHTPGQVGDWMNCASCGQAWAEKCSHLPMGWHCTGCNGHNVSVLRDPLNDLSVEEYDRMKRLDEIDAALGELRFKILTLEKEKQACAEGKE